jgi:hypothetical protein
VRLGPVKLLLRHLVPLSLPKSINSTNSQGFHPSGAKQAAEKPE